ncbi:MAG: PAS domain-containing protein [Actinobacteria bacterium]|nr:PAS domain-containing protein [Actinomycetota bacterium]
MGQILEPLSSQWQLAFFALCVVMGAMLWRAHRQVSSLGVTADTMRESLERLEHTVGEISGRTTNTEHTLIANLAEYRMALGSTSAYREYLQRLGVAPASDVEPILEAIPDGAVAVSKEGRVLYVNRAYAEATSVEPGMTLDEISKRCEVRTFEGDRLTLEQLPESCVLRGEQVKGTLVRIRPAGASREVILSVNGEPARDVLGRVVAAVMVAREVSEEVAMAIEVRRMTRESTTATLTKI